MENVIFKIDGMTCGACVQSVSRVLNETVGVAHVEVDLAQARATVQFDANQTDVAQLIEKIENAGFDAHMID